MGYESRDRGFSLIETVIVAGVLGIVALSVSTIVEFTFRSAKTAEFKMNARQFVDVVEAQLKSPANCMTALPGNNFSSNTRQVNTLAKTDLLRITLDGENYDLNDQILPGLQITDLEIQGPRPTGNNDPSWNFLRTYSGTNTVSSYIVIGFQTTDGRSPYFARKIPIHFTVDDVTQPSTGITECSTDARELNAAGPGALPPGAPPGRNIVNARLQYESHYRSGCGNCSGLGSACGAWTGALARDNSQASRDHNRTVPPHDNFCDPNRVGRVYSCGYGNNNGWRWRCQITDY